MHWALGRKTRCFPTAVRPIGGGIYAEPGIEEFLRWDLDGGENAVAAVSGVEQPEGISQALGG